MWDLSVGFRAHRRSAVCLLRAPIPDGCVGLIKTSTLPPCRVNFYLFDPSRSFAICGDAPSEAIALLYCGQVIRLGSCSANQLTEIAREAPGDWRAGAVVPSPLPAENIANAARNRWN